MLIIISCSRINLPPDLTELSPFICPTLFDTHLIMETTSIFDPAKVPKRLQDVSEQICKYMTEHYSQEQMLTHMTVDFEALYKASTASPTAAAAIAASGFNGGVNGGGSVATSTSFVSKGSSTMAGSSLMSSSVQSSEPKSFMAKHAKTSEGVPISEHEFRFRYCHFRYCDSIAFTCCGCV